MTYIFVLFTWNQGTDVTIMYWNWNGKDRACTSTPVDKIPYTSPDYRPGTPRQLKDV